MRCLRFRQSPRMARCVLFSVITVACLLVSVAAQDSGSGSTDPLVDATYRWRAELYSACSRTCEGIQSRRVYCQGTAVDTGTTFVEANETLCVVSDPRLKPINSRSCGVECANYTWIEDPWRDCSSICGPGIQSRRVVCQKQTRTSTTVTSDNDCAVALETPKPATTRPCVSVCAYETTVWSVCSTTCGDGTRTRAVSCIKTSNGDAQVPIINCDNDPSLGTRPPASESCNLGPCCTYRWEAEPYGPCSRTCEGEQTRRVYCSCNTPDGGSTEVSNETLCNNNDPRLKPIEQRSCGEECATYSWLERPWGSCTAVCGPGIERRQVICRKATNTATTTVTDSECITVIGSKPSTTRDCVRVCRVVPGPWTDCSVTCGCGQQTRTVTCVQTLPGGGERNVDLVNCENDPAQDEDLPPTSQQCEEICYSWDPQAWGACSTTCGAGSEERDVPCMKRACDGFNRVDDSECRSVLSLTIKPDTTRDCDPDCYYDPDEWSPCSRTCGRGTRVRNVRCMKVADGGDAQVAIFHCNQDTSIPEPRPPPATESCALDVCPVPPVIRDPPTKIPPGYVPPDADVSYYIRQDMYAIEGNGVSVDCTEIEADPLARMWVELPPDGTRLDPGDTVGRFSVVRNNDRSLTLNIADVMVGDEGTYRCVAQNSLGGAIVGTDTADSQLTVYRPPKITNNVTRIDGNLVDPLPGPVPVVETPPDRTVVFACQAAIGKPPPDVDWYIGNTKISATGRYIIQPDGSLMIRNARQSDAVDYRCEARNIVGTDQSFVSLKVEEPDQMWQMIPGPCSHTCGGLGSQIIAPKCIRESDGAEVDDAFCSGQDKPDARREPCGRQRCLARWETDTYGACSATCDGTQERDVWCQQVQADGRIVRVPDSVCDIDDLRLEPISTRTCGVECEEYAWTVELYGECSAQCGEGVQTREVFCVRMVGTSSVRVPNRECENRGLSMPATSRPCDPANLCRYEVSEWSDCSTSCDLGIQTRTVVCRKITDTGTVAVPLQECENDPDLTKPITQRPCFSRCPCEFPRWEVGSYSPCPVSCEGGDEAKQTRSVDCKCSIGGNPPQVADDKDCAQLIKPRDTRPCGQERCPCIDHYWLSGPYGECSLSCGTIGQRKRTVDCICFRNGERETTNILRCHQGSRPAETEDCYPPPCPCSLVRWAAGNYSECSKTCNGEQTRPVYCVCDDNGETVDDDVCIAATAAARPPAQRRCNDECPCIKHRYRISSWSYCSVTCGAGIQTRKAGCLCSRENVYEETTDRATCESEIGSPFPISERPCYTPCPCQDLSYRPGEWSPCIPNECDGYRNRTLSCYCDGVIIDMRHCDAKYIRRPHERIRCRHCPFIWQPGPWSECDANCRRRRTVYCKNSETGEKVPKSYCHAHSTMAKPDRSEHCTYTGDKRKITWEVTAWSDCSKPCLIAGRQGTKRRSVTCVDRCNRVKADGCNPRSRPRHLMRCNNFPCDNTQCKDVKGWNCTFVRKNNMCNEPEWNYRCCASCAVSLYGDD